MPPKKNISKTVNKTNPDKPKTRLKKENIAKPKSKTVVGIKVQVQNGRSLFSEPTKRGIKLSAQRKIELANAVAKSQLIKDEPVSCTKIKPVKEEVKKKGRKKRVTSEFFQASSDEVVAEENKETKTNTKKRIIRKTPNETKVLINKPAGCVTRKRFADEIATKPIKRAKIVKSKPEASKICKTKKVTCNNLGKTRQSKLNQTKAKDKIDAVYPPSKFIHSPSLLDAEFYEVDTVKTVVKETVEEKAIEEKTDENNTDNVELGVRKATDTRKTSIGSSSSLSWTKDISSSSVTTCVTVTSNDFIRFNKKLPLIKLNNIEHEVKDEMPKSDSSSSNSSSDSESSDSESENLNPDTVLTLNNSINLNSALSTSDTQNVTNDNVNKLGRALDKLSSQLKKFDMEIVNWIGYENEVDTDVMNQFQDRFLKVLTEESDVIQKCRHLRTILCDSEDNNDNCSEAQVESREENVIDNSEFAELDFFHHSYNNFDDATEYNHTFSPSSQYNEKDSDLQCHKQNHSENISFSTTERAKSLPKSLEQNYDDDDALSLFAESITGIESSKHSNSVSSVCNPEQEYVPEPVKNSSTDKFVYYPTKISKESISDADSIQNNTRAVCEKQNADSTSIYKDLDNASSNDTLDVSAKPNLTKVNECKNIQPRSHQVVPTLMSSIYKPLPGQKSRVFYGYCFFFQLSSCKNIRCRFPHVHVPVTEIKARLRRLREDLFIQEYMLMRNWPELRRLYGLCFVEECQRRDLTRILVEMAIDFSMKANSTSTEDAQLKLDVIEYVLLHLNSVQLSVYGDLLMYKLHSGSMLCDVFMDTIANTQNFSRFKSVFLAMTYFCVQTGRTFSLNVAEHILERVSILPRDEPLVRAVLDIIKYTDIAIFQNAMIGQFEKQLLSLNSDLFSEYSLLKKHATMTNQVLRNSYMNSPHLPQLAQLEHVEKAAVIPKTIDNAEKARYTSPDTTNYDNKNKAPDKPLVIRRTIENIPRTFVPSASSESNDSDELRQNVEPNRWRHPAMSVMVNRPMRGTRPLPHRRVMYRGSPTKFLRRSDRKF